MVSLAHSPQNDHRHHDFMLDVGKAGRAAASGKDALPGLGVAIVTASASGVIDTVKDKHGKGIDDAKLIYERYMEEFSEKAVHEHSTNGVKANTSKTRKLIEFGAMSCNPEDVLRRAIELRAAMEAAEEKVKPAYASYVDVARAQLDNPDSPLSDDQIKEALRKPDPKEKTSLWVIEKMLEDCEGLITGDKWPGLKDQSEPVLAVRELLKDYSALLTLTAKREKLRADAAELGEALVEREPEQQEPTSEVPQEIAA
jgi:hypothetical protein